ncbi:aliphatic sulfonate ABC transporter substrate-binding protein [Caldalkalibacillus salinus]|uniref:aliphatic sulfonate ABC transporter substrate-binding protein n=1 Tax=Caldalkalibacillus salinus TaxID=2803787 RepID=UPI001924F0CA|nr:aliphatic sulfonate ABC transporter substrate-binding protein [Caldalkalibacillus salinus]
MKKNIISARLFLLLVACLVVIATGCAQQTSSDKPEKIVLDYAYYSPTSLVLKEFGWAEEAFAEEGIEVEFVLSQGSNKALELLNSDSVDFGSTAGAAALISKANTNAPIEAVYIYSKPEWTALVTNADSGIQSVEDLSGKRVAATLGTDPFIFLLRALNEVGLSQEDIELVPLQHGDGAMALTSEQVDAWAGLDPHMARVELEADAALFYRNPDFNTYGFLNVRSAFAEAYPAYVDKVIALYERARKWTIDNPDEAAEILAQEASLDLEVATHQLQTRNDFSQPIPGDVHREALVAAAEVLQLDETIRADADIDQSIENLIQPAYAERVIEGEDHEDDEASQETAETTDTAADEEH